MKIQISVKHVLALIIKGIENEEYDVVKDIAKQCIEELEKKEKKEEKEKKDIFLEVFKNDKGGQ